MKISCIVAAAKNNVIGKDNDIPWHLPADLKYFKRITMGRTVIMGRNCFESIGRPLPKRTNIILTRDPYYISSGCIMAHSIQEALQIAEDSGETEAFIIGGGKVYEQTIHLWEKLYYTDVDLEVEGDVFFPEIDQKEWQLQSAIYNPTDEKNAFNFTFKVYDRIKKE